MWCKLCVSCVSGSSGSYCSIAVVVGRPVGVPCRKFINSYYSYSYSSNGRLGLEIRRLDGCAHVVGRTHSLPAFFIQLRLIVTVCLQFAHRECKIKIQDSRFKVQYPKKNQTRKPTKTKNRPQANPISIFFFFLLLNIYIIIFF